MSQVKLKKFSSRYSYHWGDKKSQGSAAWIPYGHKLLEEPPEKGASISIVGAMVENNNAEQPYSGLVLRQVMDYQPGRAEHSPMVWNWGLIEPTDHMTRLTSRPLSPNARKLVAAGILEQIFTTRSEAVQALEGVLVSLEVGQ